MKKKDLEIALQEAVNLPYFKFTKIGDSMGFKKKQSWGSVYLSINASYFSPVSIKLRPGITALFTVDRIESFIDFYFKPYGYESNRLTFTVYINGMFDENFFDIRNENELQYAVNRVNNFIINSVLPGIEKFDSVAQIYTYAEAFSMSDLTNFYGSINIKRLVVRAMVKDPFIDECIERTKNLLIHNASEYNDTLGAKFLANYDAFVIGLKELWDTTTEDIEGLVYKRGDYGDAV
ncbi:MAG TPA: hypothetical protein DIW47_03540 [Bacteroidetes bacterium]|nr:hypothetical protein [Bacteroidota bacterium]